jgi:hypothetical protein
MCVTTFPGSPEKALTPIVIPAQAGIHLLVFRIRKTFYLLPVGHLWIPAFQTVSQLLSQSDSILLFEMVYCIHT